MTNLSPADELRSAITALEPDARTHITVAIRQDGSTNMVTLEERHTVIAQFNFK